MNVLPFSLYYREPSVNKAQKQKEQHETAGALSDTAEPPTKGRSIVLSVEIWDALDKDAKRCGRSSIKQLEAILLKFYEIDRDIEVDAEQARRVARQMR